MRRANNFTMHLDPTTRKDLKEICEAGRFVNSIAATIRGVVGQYIELLRLQVRQEKKGRQLFLVAIDPETDKVVERLPAQLRL